MGEVEKNKFAALAWPSSGNAAVCGPGESGGIIQAIRKKYSEVSISLDGKFSYPTGKEGAELLV